MSPVKPLDTGSRHVSTTKRAVLVGATGLVGRELLGQLLAHPDFAHVTVLGRRSVGVTDPKLTEHLVDFARAETWRPFARGEVFFCALGTTRKAAGSQAAQYVVDHDYPLALAAAARSNGAEAAAVVSSAGASVDSAFFYSRMKGELERDLAALGYPRLYLLRPGPLDGAREEPRWVERGTLGMLRPLSPLLPAWARPIQASVVAKAALALATGGGRGTQVIEATELFRLGG
jgi:uncharacterized protein YbjT (DUF2867 family)